MKQPTKTRILIKQDPEKPMPVEILAEHIKAMAVGVRKLRTGGLSDRALFLLIQDAAPHVPAGFRKRVKVGIREIEAVFDGIEKLEKHSLRNWNRPPKPEAK